MGVLRNIIFEPPIPSSKKRAMERIGYGGDAVLNKVALRLSSPLCPSTWQKIGSLPDLSQRDPSIFLWTNMHSVLGAQILVGFISGSQGAYFDITFSEEELLRRAKESLRSMFPKKNFEIVAWKGTRWLSDPYSRGSYSFENGASTLEDRLELFRPIDHRIYFAGEATHPVHYGTVHGALISGEQAAAAVHNRYCCHRDLIPSTPWNR